MGAEGLQIWVLSRNRERRGSQVPFYPEISTPGRPEPCPPPKKTQMREEGARMAALGRKQGSAASVVIWVESGEGGQGWVSVVGTGQPPKSSYSDTQACQAVGGLKSPSSVPFHTPPGPALAP